MFSFYDVFPGLEYSHILFLCVSVNMKMRHIPARPVRRASCHANFPCLSQQKQSGYKFEKMCLAPGIVIILKMLHYDTHSGFCNPDLLLYYNNVIRLRRIF